MKKIIYFCMVAIVASCSSPKRDKPLETAKPDRPDDAVVIVDQPGTDTLKGSLRAKATGNIGDAQFTVRYHSPAVRERIVWGGLVPFDKVWVTGAHMATSVEVDRDITVAGQVLRAGKYGFFTIPGKETWTLVLNSNWEQHLTDEYDEKLDVVRLEVKPTARDVRQERLQYTIVQDDAATGRIVVRWDMVEVALPLTTVP